MGGWGIPKDSQSDQSFLNPHLGPQKTPKTKQGVEKLIEKQSFMICSLQRIMVVNWCCKWFVVAKEYCQSKFFEGD